jgi:gluconolactonase
LLFTDIPNNVVYKWQVGAGATLFMKPSGYTGSAEFTGREPGANGLTFDMEGRLVLAEHGDRRIAWLESDGNKTTLVSRYNGKRINSPNDVVFKSNGDLYFTDPPFGLPGTFSDSDKELPFQGVYRWSKSGELTLLTKEIKAPNGIAFSPRRGGICSRQTPPCSAALSSEFYRKLRLRRRWLNLRHHRHANAAIYRIRLSTKGVGF